MNSSTNPEQIASKLDYIPAENYETWVRAGMALKAELGDAGFGLFDQWSQSADNYSSKACESTWRSFNGKGVTGATIHYLAKQYGWTPDKPSKPYIAAPQKKAPKPMATTKLYALELWMGAVRNDTYVAAHTYCQRKGIYCAAGAGRVVASGSVIGQHQDCVIVPQRTLDDKIIGVEVINDKGQKQTFGNKGILILGNDLDSDLPQLVCEGWATGFRLLHIMGNAAVYCCFGKGGMEQTAQALTGKYPSRKVLIMAEGNA